jgi:hypothetical protein
LRSVVSVQPPPLLPLPPLPLPPPQRLCQLRAVAVLRLLLLLPQ